MYVFICGSRCASECDVLIKIILTRAKQSQSVRKYSTEEMFFLSTANKFPIYLDTFFTQD